MNYKRTGLILQAIAITMAKENVSAEEAKENYWGNTSTELQKLYDANSIIADAGKDIEGCDLESLIES